MPGIINAVEQVDVEIDLHDAEIAYEIGDRYFTIQHTEGGFDYTFYGDDYRELDGGIYENPGLTIEEAIEEILEDEGLAFEDCQVINYEEFMERTEAANRIVPLQVQPEEHPIYPHSAAYAREHGETEAYRQSKKENISCRDAIEDVIRKRFDGMHLASDAAKVDSRNMGQRGCPTFLPIPCGIFHGTIDFLWRTESGQRVFMYLRIRIRGERREMQTLL